MDKNIQKYINNLENENAKLSHELEVSNSQVIALIWKSMGATDRESNHVLTIFKRNIPKKQENNSQ